jgi:uncharacterized ubiquitin-like protein YukD
MRVDLETLAFSLFQLLISWQFWVVLLILWGFRKIRHFQVETALIKHNTRHPALTAAKAKLESDITNGDIEITLQSDQRWQLEILVSHATQQGYHRQGKIIVGHNNDLYLQKMTLHKESIRTKNHNF